MLGYPTRQAAPLQQTAPAQQPAPASDPEYIACVANRLRPQAVARGIPAESFDRYMAGVTPDRSVLDLAKLPAALQALLTPLAAVSYLVFILLYTPCVAAMAALKREMENGWLTFAAIIGQCVFAWLIAWLVYLTGSLIL